MQKLEKLKNIQIGAVFFWKNNLPRKQCRLTVQGVRVVVRGAAEGIFAPGFSHGKKQFNLQRYMSRLPNSVRVPAFFRGSPAPIRFPRTLALAAVLLTLGFGAGRLPAQKLDLTLDGLSDVWQFKFGAFSIFPDADSDGDGVPDGLEAIAGTNPFDSNSVPRIPVMAFTATNFTVTLPCELGKLYQLQSIPGVTNVGGGNWTNETSAIPRAGSVLSLSAPRGPATKFFRVVISDVDTDGDGLSDWEEYQLGLDPLTPTSNGQLDGNGQAVGDYAYAAARIALQGMVTITATDPAATQPDAGQTPLAYGQFTVTRAGFPLDTITVNLGLKGPGPGVAVEGLDHAALPRSVVLPAGTSSLDIPVTPLADTNLLAPVLATMNVQPGGNYIPVVPTNATVVIYPSITVTGTGLYAQYFTNANVIYTNTNNFNPVYNITNRIDPVIDFRWYTNLSPNLSNGNWTVRWTGQVMPQYSESYFFYTYTDDGVKLWVNDQLLINKWTNQTVTNLIGSIALQGGVRYNLKMEYLNLGGTARAQLYWWSASQPEQIIPANRLFPTNATSAPAAIVSPLYAVGFVGQPFTYTMAAANSGSNYTATGLPPGLAFNATNGVISGTPNFAGDFQVSLSTSNAAGLGAAVLFIQIFDTGSSVVREVWTNVPGTNVADIPVNSPASFTNILATLAGITNFGDNYGERIRGYLTAPATGNYYFWLAASDAAELWISNDREPVNKVRRARSFGAAAQQWNLQPSQRTPWLALVAGQRYYFEVLHKAGVGTNDHWEVGWLQSTTGTNTVPATNAPVPGYVLSRFYPLPPVYVPGTLYAANMLAQAGVNSTGVGSATLRLSADGAKAILKFNYSGLSSGVTGEHIHNDAYLAAPSMIMFDIDTSTPQPDGSRVWDIGPVGNGALSAADVVEIIRSGKAYINLHTANFGTGEINGHFTAVEGSQTFTPPPDPPVPADDHTSSNAAARFLIQATFGPSANDIAAVQSLGYDGWISNQIAMPVSHHLTNVLANKSSDPNNSYPGSLVFNTWWQQSVTAPDQLRQRVAFALSEIMVVSQQGVLGDNGRALSDYYDTLLDNAFGNYRELLEAVTLTPAMGLYLDMRKNDKGDILLGTHANENYGREILQLFSIGLNRLWADGTLVLDSTDNLVPTYDQNVIMGYAADFTGWNYYQTNQTNGHLPSNWSPNFDYINPMVLVPTHHDLGTKRLLDNIVLPAAQGAQTITTNFEFDNYGLQDLELALDAIFYNENVGPFICRQLIQRLVTSHPSRGYLYRVVQKFNDNGSGVRGDLAAVIRAILLDYEARSPGGYSAPTFGKQREPLLRVTAPARAFPAPLSVGGTYAQTGSRAITVTTTNAHRLNNSDVPLLVLTDTSGAPPPTSQGYSVTVTGANTFTFNAPGVTSATYGQSSNVITITNNSHGLSVGNQLYLIFTSGTGSNGVYQVASVPGLNSFTVATTNAGTTLGNCLIPKLTGGGFVQTGTNMNLSITGNHNLFTNDLVQILFSYGATDGVYQVTGVPDLVHFITTSSVSNNQTQGSITVFPLVPPPWTRSGNVAVQYNTWNMNTTEAAGNNAGLAQTPLNAATVFNFFFPDFKFPGTLTSAGLTTPEFQLTSDTGVAFQMNFLEQGVMPATNNVSGLTSFINNSGAIFLDIGPWMTTNYTSPAGVPALVDSLNTLLAAGQLSAAAKTNIIDYVTNTVNFPYGAPPNAAQMRDRVRAVAHLILISPDFTIQK